MEGLFKDIRCGIRSILKRPAFAALAVVTLGLGIGANTAIFSVVNGILLRPLLYRDSDRIMILWQNTARGGVEQEAVSPANFLDLRAQSGLSKPSPEPNLTVIRSPERASRKLFVPYVPFWK